MLTGEVVDGEEERKMKLRGQGYKRGNHVKRAPEISRTTGFCGGGEG